ncbi:hypothetical protein KBD20_01200 [Candidatus Saccharibacteria bacterium]|nr:hypothetical protein [Candidatus Saccharibacteria bacterium]
MLDITTKHCWVLDLDRTLSSVEIVMEAIQNVCTEMKLDYTKIAEQKDLTELHGHSFSLLTTVGSLWPEVLDEFCTKFKQNDHLECIYPDARSFLAEAKKLDIPCVIITYGDPLWQSIKMELGGVIQIPHIVCDIPEKSVLLAQYRRGSQFELHTSSGIVRTETITMVDDKPVAFEAIPPGVSGILITRSDSIPTVPSAIRNINTFDEIIGELES